jgi:hypothetical protein
MSSRRSSGSGKAADRVSAERQQLVEVAVGVGLGQVDGGHLEAAHEVLDVEVVDRAEQHLESTTRTLAVDFQRSFRSDGPPDRPSIP